MPNRVTIPITTSREYQESAALSLSNHLNELGCRHAYIGGFAWSLLGSSRPTEISGHCLQSPRSLVDLAPYL